MSELIIPPNLTERLARLAELEAQATPGEWFACPPDEDGTLWVETDYDGGYPVCGLDSTRPEDAALIAEMRNALPELLAEIARLHAVIRDGQGAQAAAVYVIQAADAVNENCTDDTQYNLAVALDAYHATRDGAGEVAR